MAFPPRARKGSTSKNHHRRVSNISRDTSHDRKSHHQQQKVIISSSSWCNIPSFSRMRVITRTCPTQAITGTKIRHQYSQRQRSTAAGARNISSHSDEKIIHWRLVPPKGHASRLQQPAHDKETHVPGKGAPWPVVASLQHRYAHAPS